MSETLVWWLALQVVGLAALPLCLLLFRWLPDRGYSLSKAFGLIMLGYAFWIINIPFNANTTATAWWVIVLLGASSAYAFTRRREELLGFARSHWRLIAGFEGLLFLAFVMGAYLRSYVPEISGTEKPMDFMFLNAMLRADGFPPHDPWLEGWNVAYYYFGYLMIAILTRISGVASEVGFNLGLATIAALAIVGAAGLVYNLVAMREQGDREPEPPPKRSRRKAAAPEAAAAAAAAEPRSLISWRAFGFGIGAGLLLAIMGNLEGVLEFLAGHNVGSAGFWSWVGIENLDREGSAHWYPDEHWFWWHATRILDDSRGIHEFPFFSFLLGDLHPHVMSIPFVLLAVGAALALLRSGEPLDLVFWLSRPLWLAALAIMLGGLAFLNTWDMPTLSLVVVLIAALRNRLLAGRWSWGLALDTLGFALPLFLLAFLAYTPFFFGGFDSQAAGFTAEAGSGSRMFHALLIWGPFAVLVLPYAAWRLSRHGGPVAVRDALWALAPALAIFAVWLVWDALPDAFGWLPGPLQVNDARTSFGDRLADRGTSWLTAIFMAGALGLLGLALVRETGSGREPAERRLPHMFALALAGVAALLILGVEFIYIEDGFDSRMNTIFKLYYQAWLLLSVAGGFALYELVRGLDLNGLLARRPAEAGPSSWRYAWGGVAAVVLLAAFVYPLLATFNRTNGFDLPRTLDGLAYLSPDERAAIDWLADLDGRPVIVEAVGDDYSDGGRVSAATGLPTPLQWPGHELQWRGTSSPQDGRKEAVEVIYSSTDADEVRSVLQQFGITFVVLGSVERAKYPQAALAELDGIFEPEPAFEQGEVTVYRVKASVLSQVTRE